MAPARRPPRVLYVGTLPPHQGGSALTNLQVVDGLAALGHRIDAIAPITENLLRAGDPLGHRSALARGVDLHVGLVEVLVGDARHRHPNGLDGLGRAVPVEVGVLLDGPEPAQCRGGEGEQECGAEEGSAHGGAI